MLRQRTKVQRHVQDLRVPRAATMPVLKRVVEFPVKRHAVGPDKTGLDCRSTPDDVAAVIYEDFGVPASQLFFAFSPEPIASASLAQVHVAWLRNEVCFTGSSADSDLRARF